MTAALIVLALAFGQNITFSLVSRARNRSHHGWHAAASLISNATWFACFSYLSREGWGAELAIPYIIGSTGGSIFGTAVAMRIEAALNASADGHLAVNNKDK